MNIENRILYAAAKMRNMIYYRLTIEENLIDTRYRCQYMVILRKYRTTLIELVRDMDPGDFRIEWFMGVIATIDPKVKSDECKDTIKRLRDYSNKNGYPICHPV